MFIFLFFFVSLPLLCSLSLSEFRATGWALSANFVAVDNNNTQVLRYSLRCRETVHVYKKKRGGEKPASKPALPCSCCCCCIGDLHDIFWDDVKFKVWSWRFIMYVGSFEIWFWISTKDFIFTPSLASYSHGDNSASGDTSPFFFCRRVFRCGLTISTLVEIIKNSLTESWIEADKGGRHLRLSGCKPRKGWKVGWTNVDHGRADFLFLFF